MTGITISTVLVPVADQDAGIKFYTEKLGCTVAVDTPFAGTERWVEIALPGGGATIALVPPRGDMQPGRPTGISLSSADPRAAHGELAAAGVDVDAELMGGDGTVPLLFFFRDGDGNQLMMVADS